MDKAKAYDEALERARKQRDDYQKELNKTDKNSQLAGLLRAGISAVEMIFPQLKDSNDERIRKSLIEFLTDIKEISESGRTVWAVREDDAEMCESFIAYLEKQKEQKPAWSEEDEDNLHRVIRVLEDNDSDWKELSDWLKALRPDSYKNCNSRWKPSEEQMAALEAATVRYQSTGLESLFEDLKKL